MRPVSSRRGRLGWGDAWHDYFRRRWQQCDWRGRVNEENFEFSFETETNRNYVVQWTGSLLPATWQEETNFSGYGSAATVPVSMTSTQRFYRVLAQ